MIKADNEKVQPIRERFLKACADVIEKNNMTYSKLSAFLEMSSGNFTQIRTHINRMPLAIHIYCLVTEFNISAEYIFTGLGSMYNDERVTGNNQVNALKIKELENLVQYKSTTIEILNEKIKILEKKLLEGTKK